MVRAANQEQSGAISALQGLQLALFSGKGGVGKTTLSCGLARAWAQQFPGDRVLLLSTDPAHSLGDVLQVPVMETATAIADLPNLSVQALNAEALLDTFKRRYGAVLELLVERGSFVQREDLAPVWNLSWPGLDELMSILEIQRLFHDQQVDRVVVDMAPSGHTLNLFGLMDFLDEFLAALALFQEKHRVMQQTFGGRAIADEADNFLHTMKTELTTGRQLLQNPIQTGCFVVAIAEPMSLLETRRFLTALATLQIPCGGVFVNRVISAAQAIHDGDRYAEQQPLLNEFLAMATPQPLLLVPQQPAEPTGATALDALIPQIHTLTAPLPLVDCPQASLPTKLTPNLPDFIALGRRLILVGGKGGVGKTTVAAAIALAMAEQHPAQQVRVISIDPAHSLGDAFGLALGHEPRAIAPNLSGQEIDADLVLEQFREDYLWELAAMMSGDTGKGDATLQLAYGPEAWRRIVAQSLPGIDEMLSLVTVVDLLEAKTQDLIVLDTAPTGHLLRFLEMPTAMADWLAWIFKLWMKYQDVLGQVELMSRLRTLRQRVVNAQKKLKDAQHTEFIGVIQTEGAIVAEAQRLTRSLHTMAIAQHYIVQNRFTPAHPQQTAAFPDQTLVYLPVLPHRLAPHAQLQLAAHLLF